jgi:hypothetical protein
MALRILPLPAAQSPVQAILKGAQAGQTLARNYYRNQMTADQARYLPTNLQDAERMAKAKIAGQNIQNTYAPGLDSAKTALLGNQATGVGIKNQYIPQTMAIAQQNANTKANAQKFNTQRFGNAYAFSRLAASPAGKALLASNPQLAQAYAATLGGLAGTLNPGGGLPAANGTAFTPQQIQDAQTATGAALQKETSDEKTRQQALGAQQILHEANKIDISPLQNYAGIWGKGEIEGNKVKSALGLPLSKEAVAYNTFKQFTVPQMADQIRQALQTSVHPAYVTAMLKPMIDPQSSIYNNPQEVQSRWHAFQNWLHDYAQQKTTAVTHGVPNSILGAKGVGAPEFNPQKFVSAFANQAAFQAAFNNASPEQQAAVRAYMQAQGGKK